MVESGTGEKARLKRLRTKEAITLAMQSRWQEAVDTNRSIIQVFPDDVDAYNRLGKALTELGRYDEAKEAYSRALNIDPHNSIARKNLDRLFHLKEAQLWTGDGPKVAPRLFIEETGRTGLTKLHYLAPPEVLARVTAGDQVYLRVKGQDMVVENAQGDYLGRVEPKLALRLIKLMEGGNRYMAAIANVGEEGVKVILREVFQHPSQAGRPSFPSKVIEDFRPYIKDSLFKYGFEEDEELAVEEMEPEEMPFEEAPVSNSAEDEEELKEE